MENMFSGKTEKTVPKNLSECITPDATTTNLHHWAERLENWGKILFFILIVVGIITTITDTITVANSPVEDSAVGTFISTAISWGLYAFIEYCAYHVLALLISALASITQNTIISANVALYDTAKAEGFPVTTNEYTQPLNSEDPMSCKNREQYKSDTESKPQPVQQATATPVQTAVEAPAVTEDMWECKNCGTYNKYAYGQCKRCGKYRSSMSDSSN